MNESDDTLTRLFADSRETPPAGDFLERLQMRLHQARRRRALGNRALTIATAAFAAGLTPYVVEGSLTAAAHLAGWLPAVGNALTSPVGWLRSLGAAAWSVRRARGSS